MGRVSSRWFTRYLAFKRRNTYYPDVWFSAQQQALAAAGVKIERFVPIADDQAAAARADREAQAAEDAMDAGL